MSGFLGHLIQRSLSEPTVLRPRPVSLFEPLQPAFAPDTLAAAPFEFESRPAVDDPLPTRGRFGAALDLVARSATAVETATLPVVDAEPRQPASAPPPAARMTLRDDAAGQGQPRVSPPPAATVTPSAAYERDIATEPAISKVAIPCVEEKIRPPVNKQAEMLRTKPTLSQHPLGQSPPRAAAGSDLFELPVALPSRHLHVQGKMAAPSSAQPGFERIDRPAALLAPVQAVARSASPQHPEAAESAVRSASSAPEPLFSLPRKEPATPAQAILVPRLPPQLVAQPVQPAVSQPAEPVVHVTIGRVEIRAVSAPATPKRAAASKPALSLGDYLDRRSGGRR